MQATLNPQSPPATYFGTVDPALTDQANQIVTAWIDGQQCGQGKTYDDGTGNIHYLIHVSGDGPNGGGCGSTKGTIAFQVAGKLVAETAIWQNNRVQELRFSHKN